MAKGKYILLAQESYLMLKLAGYSNEVIASLTGMSRPHFNKCRKDPSEFKIKDLEIMIELVEQIKLPTNAQP